MTRVIIVATALAAGCGQPFCTPAPAWTLSASGNIRAQGLADGTIVVLVTAVGPATVGGTAVDGPALVRVGGDGAVLASMHVAMAKAAADLRVDDRGGIAVTGAEFSGIARYDATTLAPLWSLDTAQSGPTFDIAPTGDVAFLFGYNGKLHYVDATGHERWTADVDGFSTLRLGDTGDVYVIEPAQTGGAPSRLLHFAADGTMLAPTDLPAIPSADAIGRDGSIVFLGGPYHTTLSRADVTGAVRWSVPFHASTTAPTIATNDDVIAATNLDTAVVRIDGATGAIVHQVDNCAVATNSASVQALAAASATGYVVYETGDAAFDPPPIGLAAFTGP
jgi:hypothetical protein